MTGEISIEYFWVGISKEIVSSYRDEINNLRTDMDKRFDRIERLIIDKK